MIQINDQLRGQATGDRIPCEENAGQKVYLMSKQHPRLGWAVVGYASFCGNLSFTLISGSKRPEYSISQQSIKRADTKAIPGSLTLEIHRITFMLSLTMCPSCSPHQSGPASGVDGFEKDNA